MPSSQTIERLQIIHMLGCDVRMSYAAMATVAGISEQTAARRYQTLVRNGILRCTATLDHRTLGQHEWILRITPSSEGTKLAEMLAQHDDMSWVSMTAADVVCLYQPQPASDNDLMLTDRIRSTSLVESMDARQVLRRFPLHTTWPDLGWTLDATQRERLTEAADPLFAIDRHGDTPNHDAADLSADDRRLIALLAEDPRASYSHLARVTNLTPARVATRIIDLTEAGVLRFDLEVDQNRLGLRISAALWAGVDLDKLDAAGHALARMSEIHYVCATTGPTAIFATIAARDTDHLYNLLTNELARIDGLHSIDVRTDLRTLKRSRVRAG